MVKLKYWGGSAKQVAKKFGKSPLETTARNFARLELRIYRFVNTLKDPGIMTARIDPNPKCPGCKSTEFTIERESGELLVVCDGCGKSITNGRVSKDDNDYEVHVSQTVWESIIFSDDRDYNT